MTKKILAGLLAALFLFVSGPMLAESETAEEKISLPERYDWSAIQTLLIAPRAQELPPVATDEQGNFHAYSLDRESATIEHVAVNTRGEIFIQRQAELPHIDEDTLLAATPFSHGLTLLWSTIDSDGNWQLYTAFWDEQGSLGDTQRLAYNISHPNQIIDTRAGLSRVMLGLSVAMDKDGRMHISMMGGIPREMRAIYILFDTDLEMIRAEGVPTGRSWIRDRRAFSGGQIIVDAQGTAYILNDFSGRMYMDIVQPDSSPHTVDLGPSTFNLAGFGSGGLYTVRRVGPVMDIDEEGTVHIVYNNLTKPPSLTPHIVDVGYIQVRDGQVVLDKIITNQMGVSHYPTVTANGGRVYIAWEETSGSTHELYYSVLDYQGDILSGFKRLTWEQAYSRLGFIYADDQGELHAFWWRPDRDGQDRLAYKNTVNPVPYTIWLQLGFDPYDPDSTLTGQLFYYGIMTIISSIGQVVANLHLMLLVIGLLFILYKLQVLDFLLERPWTLFLMLLVLMYPLMPRISAAESAFAMTGGYHFFVWLAAAGMSSAMMMLLKIRPNSTLNLVLGCCFWLLAAVMMQMVPIVPMSFAI